MLDTLFKARQRGGDPLDDFHSKMIAKAVAKGKSLAEQGLPNTTFDKLSTYTGEITAGYRSKLSDSMKAYGGDHARLAQAEKESLTGKGLRIEKLLEKHRESYRKLRIEKDSLPHNDYESHKTFGLWVVIVVLAAAEGIFAHPAFRLFDASNNFLQYLLLAGLVVFFTFLPHAVIGIYKATEESRYKTPIRIGTGVTILMGFYVLAVMRGMYLQNIGSTTMANVKAVSTLPMKPWFFMAVSMLFMVVTCYCAFLLPDKSQKKSNVRAKQIDGKLAELDAEISRLERDHMAIPDMVYASEQRVSRQRQDGESMKQRINAMHVEAIHAFITSNQTYRTDQPTCYTDEIPSLN